MFILLMISLSLIVLNNINIVSSSKKKEKKEKEKDENQENFDKESYEEFFEYFQGFAQDFSDDFTGNNPYTELSIPPWSTFSDVKKKYHKLVKIYHPDRSGSDKNSADKFMRIQKAFEKIKKKRKIQSEEDEEESTFKNLSNVIVERIINIFWTLVILGLLKFLIWLTGLFFNLIYIIVINFLISHLFFDTFFSHLLDSNKLFLLEVVFAYLFYYITTPSKSCCPNTDSDMDSNSKKKNKVKDVNKEHSHIHDKEE
jgi:hypothetical protein